MKVGFINLDYDQLILNCGFESNLKLILRNYFQPQKYYLLQSTLAIVCLKFKLVTMLRRLLVISRGYDDN